MDFIVQTYFIKCRLYFIKIEGFIFYLLIEEELGHLDNINKLHFFRNKIV